mmetsp:Transcript_134333/g.237660  ORF Transcript_134333/g.237660 Transcript_134333/m.237660 type:complete len:424 (+) Transcript_134333:83-1354(+)
MVVTVGSKQQMTQEQCIEAQQMIKVIVSTSAMQQKFDQLETKAGGDADEYHLLVSAMLRSEVYPTVCANFGIPPDQVAAGTKLIFGSIQHWSASSVAMTEAWLELEMLMRNKRLMRAAEVAVSRVKASQFALENSPKEKEEEITNTDMVEVFDAAGKVMGVVVHGRIRGACVSTNCSCYKPSSSNVEICECGAPYTSHEDKGPDPSAEEEVEEMLEVKCVSLKVPQASWSDTIRCEMPSGTTIAEFRSTFKDMIPHHAVISAAEPGKSSVRLRDTDTVAESMTVSELVAEIPAEYILTHKQAKQAQNMLRAILNRFETQQLLDRLETESQGNAAKYRMKLNSVCVSKFYPEVGTEFGLPADNPMKSAKLITMAIQAHSVAGDMSMVETWKDLETLMRNKAQVAAAEKMIAQMASSQSSKKLGA